MLERDGPRPRRRTLPGRGSDGSCALTDRWRKLSFSPARRTLRAGTRRYRPPLHHYTLTPMPVALIVQWDKRSHLPLVAVNNTL